MAHTFDQSTLLFRQAASFPRPFDTVARRLFPTTMQEVFDWAEALWLYHGLYSMGIRRAVRYFMTDIKISGDTTSNETIKEYRKYLLEDLDILELTAIGGDDYFSSGNGFISSFPPFERQLDCPECKVSLTMRKVPDLEFVELSIRGQCPKCSNKVTFGRKDVKAESKKPVIFTRWSPYDITIDHNAITNRSIYYLKPESDIMGDIRGKNRIYWEDTPWDIIEAAMTNKPFRFTEGTLYHMRCDVCATLLPRVRGWGLPMFLSNFTLALQCLYLLRYNEAAILDYLMPLRVISPPSGGAGAVASDPLMQTSMTSWSSHIQRMLVKHRIDPATWNTLPFPVQYQALGAESSQLAPVEQLKFFSNLLLEAMGIPVEIASGQNLGFGQVNTLGLKMFEKTWGNFVKSSNGFLNWAAKKVGEHRGWDEVRTRLLLVSIYEDDKTKQVKLSLAAANQISKRTALAPFGIDADEEAHALLEEQRDLNDMIAEYQDTERKRLELKETLQGLQQANAGQMPPGALPGPGAPIDPSVPTAMSAPAPAGNAGMEEMILQADQMAQNLLTMEATARRSMLINLKKTDEVLHSLVSAKLEDMEQQAGTAGKAMARAGQI